MKVCFSSWTMLGVCIALLGVGCSGPPIEEMMQAETALQAAQAAGAEDYVAVDYNAAAEALKDAKSKTESSDYEGALTSAIDARQKAEKSKAKVASEKLKVRGDLESTLTGLNQEWDGLVASNRKKHLDRAIKAELDAAYEAYAQLIADVRDRMEAKDYIAAMQVMKEARMKITEIRELVGG